MRKIFYIALIILGMFLFSACQKQPDDLLQHNLKDHNQLALHIHPTVEIEIFGEKQVIPDNVGIFQGGMRVIHTHKTDGILHVESPYPHQFYLRDFFTIWGKSFDKNCIFEYCTDDQHELKVYLNSVEDSRYGDIPLFDKDVIRIVYKKKN